MFIVTLVSIISVSLLTSLVMMQMSERLFMNTFSITNQKSLTRCNEFRVIQLFHRDSTNNVLQSGTIKAFLTESGYGHDCPDVEKSI